MYRSRLVSKVSSEVDANGVPVRKVARAKASGDWEEREKLMDEKVVLEGLVQQQGRSDLQHELARAYLQQGSALRHANRTGQALRLCDRAVAVWERLVRRGGTAQLFARSTP